MSNRAWVTLATNDSYGLGALVLAHSLRRAASSYPVVVLITPSVTDAMRERLRSVFADVVTVDVLDSRDATHLALLQRPELGITFTKIHCWSLTQYEKCVFLDADTLVIQNCDELFEREELSAAPDVGWPDCFNSGVFVFKPSAETFEQLIKFAQERGSFDGGDQGLLNSFFSDWAHGDINKHLPFLYNVTSAAFYSYLPALKHYGQNLKIIHFIGIVKPWLQQFNWVSRTVDAPDHLRGFLQLWWDLFVGQVHSQLDETMVEVQDPTPALPPHDVSQHYAPVLDPESEFPWHHPDAQPKDDYRREEIDLNQFHDPWGIYGGQIPPNKEETSTHNTFSGRVEDHEEMKKYAWEYQAPHQEYNPSQYSQESTSHHQYQPEPTYQYHEHDRHETQTHYHTPEHHWESHSHHHQPEEHHWHQNQHQHKHQDYSYHVEHVHKNQQEYTEHGHTHYSHERQHDHSANTSDHQHDHSADTSDHQSHYHHSHQPYHEHSHRHSDHHTEKHEHEHSDFKSHSLTHNLVEQVNRVHIDHDTILNLQTLKESRLEKTSSKMMNGDISESESEYYEDIKPRHPYDGFYLRHKATIDPRGRKICTHEVPPTPSPSLSPPPDLDPIECPLDLLTEETPYANDDEHSGVAGNLARVTPGESVSQREALDELTRRQGWEAGNIDYMGADSFDNIWAKISQTLSQTRVSPPKQPSPPKEPSPPKQEASVPPVEVAQEAAIIDAPAGEAVSVVEVPVIAKAAAPVETPVLAEVPVTVEAVEAALKVEAPGSKATPTIEAAESVAPAEIPATVEAVAAVASKPQEAAAPLVEPLDIPATVEAASAPGEAPKSIEAPSEVPISVETTAALEVAKDEPQKTETPALPPTPPVTPKSTPESTPTSESAPPVEAQTEVSVLATEPASESAPLVESLEAPKEEIPAPTSEPVSESSPKVESDTQKEEVPIPVSESVPAVESVETKKEEEPASVPESESAPKVNTVEIQKEDVPVSKSVPASESAPTVETQKEEVLSSSAPTSENAPKVETQKEEVQLASAPASESVPKVETQTEKSSASDPALESAPKVETQADAVSPASASASESAPKVETQTEAVSPASVPASESAPKVETQIEAVPAASALASESAPKVETQREEVAPAPTSEGVPQVEPVESPKEEAPVPVEAPKDPEGPATPASSAPASPAKSDVTPKKPSEVPSPAASTDSPPLANTPSKEEAPALPAAKSEERRKVGKLQLRPPAVADPLPTPDSELEDAATLAQSIIASELRSPTVTAPDPAVAVASPPQSPQEKRLSVEGPEVPTPPISLAQIGVKSAPKAKPTIAAQIESSLAEKSESVAPSDQPAPKKKVVKKVKKESAVGAGAEAPVPPPRKKEKKPKEK